MGLIKLINNLFLFIFGYYTKRSYKIQIFYFTFQPHTQGFYSKCQQVRDLNILEAEFFYVTPKIISEKRSINKRTSIEKNSSFFCRQKQTPLIQANSQNIEKLKTQMNVYQVINQTEPRNKDNRVSENNALYYSNEQAIYIKCHLINKRSRTTCPSINSNQLYPEYSYIDFQKRIKNKDESS